MVQSNCQYSYEVNLILDVAIYGIRINKYNPFLDLSNMSSMEKSELLRVTGKKIQELREKQGLTQLDLAAKIEGDFDTTNVSRIESGRTNPTLYTLYRIAKALEVDLSKLLINSH